MKAMILAAGFGTRLKPLTEDTPKALIAVNGIPLIELQIKKLSSIGFTDIIINVLHLAEKIIDFVKSKSWGASNIEFSIEENILDTGGGLKKASWFFEGNESFLVHNVDVITNLNIQKMIEAHYITQSLSTLAVRKRITNRYFLIDEEKNLCGWKSVDKNKTLLKRNPVGEITELSFMGIHVMSPKIFSFMPDEEKFSLVDLYLNLAEKNLSVKAFEDNNCEWLDIGKKENLILAGSAVKSIFG